MAFRTIHRDVGVAWPPVRCGPRRRERAQSGSSGSGLCRDVALRPAAPSECRGGGLFPSCGSRHICISCRFLFRVISFSAKYCDHFGGAVRGLHEVPRPSPQAASVAAALLPRGPGARPGTDAWAVLVHWTPQGPVSSDPAGCGVPGQSSLPAAAGPTGKPRGPCPGP